MTKEHKHLDKDQATGQKPPAKRYLVKEIGHYIDSSTSVVITTFNGVNADAKGTPFVPFKAQMAADFRKRLFDSKGNFEVVRKNLLHVAAKDLGVPTEGNFAIGIAFTNEDPVPFTKVICEYMKEVEGIFKIIGGRFEGQMCTAKDIEQISKLPTKNEMRAQLLGTLEAPMSQTLAVMQALLTSVIYCIENKNQKN